MLRVLGRQLLFRIWTCGALRKRTWNNGLRKRIGPSGFFETCRPNFPAWLEQSSGNAAAVQRMPYCSYEGAGCHRNSKKRNTLWRLLKEQQLRKRTALAPGFFVVALLAAAAVAAKPSHPANMACRRFCRCWSWIFVYCRWRAGIRAAAVNAAFRTEPMEANTATE